MALEQLTGFYGYYTIFFPYTIIDQIHTIDHQLPMNVECPVAIRSVGSKTFICTKFLNYKNGTIKHQSLVMCWCVDESDTL